MEGYAVKLAAYSHSAADSPKKVRVQKHPQKCWSPARQPTSQKPVFSTSGMLKRPMELCFDWQNVDNVAGNNLLAVF